MLLGATLPMDDIVVEDMAGDEGTFAVNFCSGTVLRRG